MSKGWLANALPYGLSPVDARLISGNCIARPFFTSMAACLRLPRIPNLIGELS